MGLLRQVLKQELLTVSSKYCSKILQMLIHCHYSFSKVLFFPFKIPVSTVKPDYNSLHSSFIMWGLGLMTCELKEELATLC